jgi:hypothetical protein
MLFSVSRWGSDVEGSWIYKELHGCPFCVRCSSRWNTIDRLPGTYSSRACFKVITLVLPVCRLIFFAHISYQWRTEIGLTVPLVISCSRTGTISEYAAPDNPIINENNSLGLGKLTNFHSWVYSARQINIFAALSQSKHIFFIEAGFFFASWMNTRKTTN